MSESGGNNRFFIEFSARRSVLPSTPSNAETEADVCEGRHPKHQTVVDEAERGGPGRHRESRLAEAIAEQCENDDDRADEEDGPAQQEPPADREAANARVERFFLFSEAERSIDKPQRVCPSHKNSETCRGQFC